METIERIKSAVRDVADFPKEGILFKDITPILSDAELFRAAVHLFAERHREHPPDIIAAIDARGFVFGAALAYELGAGLALIRKKGKLPYKTVEASYDLEYGSATLAMHEDAVPAESSVVLIDDLLATGGTAAAAADLIEQLGGRIVEIDFLIELTFLEGRKKLEGQSIYSAITF